MEGVLLTQAQLSRLERFAEACRVVGVDRGAPLVEVREDSPPYVVRISPGGRAMAPDWFALDQLRKRRRR